MNKFIEAQKEEFSSIIEYFKKDIASLRTGRANPSLLDGVFVEAYGSRTPVAGVASISVADSRSITVVPWDKSVLKDIEKGLVEAGLGVGIVNEGDKIRLTVPVMTEENRRDLVKKLNEKMEKSRISLRQVREDVKTAVEKAFEAKEIAEDDKFKSIKELDEEVRKRNDDLKEIRDKKELDIMTI